MNNIYFSVRFPSEPTEQEKQKLLETARMVFGTEYVSLNTTATRLVVCPAKDADIALLSDMLIAQARTFSCVMVRLSDEDVGEIRENTIHVTEHTPIASQETPARKKERRVPLAVFLAAVCVVMILSILATYTLTAGVFSRKLIEAQSQIWKDPSGQQQDLDLVFPELEFFDALFEEYSIYELDHDALVTALLKAYAQASGDEYAAYYTKEELEALYADDRGEMEGIGVSVVNTSAMYNGVEYATMMIISVFADSPALAAGLRVGDQIYSVVTEDGTEATVEQLGYDMALSSVRGVAGTNAEFSVLREVTGGTYEIIKFSIERAKVTAESVTGRVHTEDSSIGVVKISQFDLTTPIQFQAVMDDLIARGCQKFIFDVRYNPGGDLASIEAVLSTLLQENDVMITVQYKEGDPVVEYVRPVQYADSSYESCNVAREDIGKYSQYAYAVITNQYTASAAELFTANLRDYRLATLVGVTTFGKGCMQTIANLENSGVLTGAIKLTTALYLPPCGESYHEIGIAPDEGYEVEMDAAVIEKYGNVYLIPDSEDPQLAAAVRALQK